MSFLSPLAFALTALVLPLVLLYFLKIRRRTRGARGSSYQQSASDLREHELLDRRIGRHAVVPDLLGAAERLGTLEELPEALMVGTHRLAVDGELTGLTGLGVDEPQVAGELGVHLLGRQHVDQMDVEPPLEQGAHARLEPVGIHEIGDHDGEPRLARPHGVVAEPVVEARPAGRLDATQELEQVHHLGAPARGRPTLGDALAQHADADALHADEADEAERRCEPRSVLELRRDRKSTRLNSSHLVISYAVFCLK